jgi:hypothetical protein
VSGGKFIVLGGNKMVTNVIIKTFTLIKIWISDIKGTGCLGFVLSTPGFDPVWYDFATDGKPHCSSSQNSM